MCWICGPSGFSCSCKGLKRSLSILTDVPSDGMTGPTASWITHRNTIVNETHIRHRLDLRDCIISLDLVPGTLGFWTRNLDNHRRITTFPGSGFLCSRRYFSLQLIDSESVQFSPRLLLVWFEDGVPGLGLRVKSPSILPRPTSVLTLPVIIRYHSVLVQSWTRCQMLHG